MDTSQKWSLEIIEEEEYEPEVEPQSPEDFLSLANTFESGELIGEGNKGHSFQLQFDAENAAILYIGFDGTTRRPRFLGRERNGDGIELFFCHCCGVQLGDKREMLAQGTNRHEGFSLARHIINGTLPESDELVWVALEPRRKGH
jgi:hypothetical protein